MFIIFGTMNSFDIYQNEVHVVGLADTFASVDFDAESQTGSDWYRLMLAASLDGAVIHGATTTATCETLAKVDEAFASKHAVARIKADLRKKQVKHASSDWRESNLIGRAYHGNTTENKSRMLFDTGEWEPATRVRAANAAFIGGLLCAQGSSLTDATYIASACAGEPIPSEAIINTELPLSVLKREAAATAKHNHVVYSYANTQKAITWDAHQFHEQTLPMDASLDWARITTIGRYIAESNISLDDRFLHYAEQVGVPYTLVKGSWASVHASDYIFDPQTFSEVRTDVGMILPTPELLGQYDKQASNTYDAIHRMANEVRSGLSDLTIDNLLRIAETYKQRQRPSKRAKATATELLGETTIHRYSSEFAAKAVSTASSSWDALISAVIELVQANRALKSSCASAVAKYKSKQEYQADLELLYLELCDSAVWLRAFDYLKAALGNHFRARDRMSHLKRSILANSAPLETPTVLTARTRRAMENYTIRLANLALVGKMPMNRMSIDSRRVVAHQNLDRHAALYTSVNAHLHTSKREWAERYQKMAEVYKLAGGAESSRKSVLYGCASKAFSMVNAYLMARVTDGFIDPGELTTSYLVAVAHNYVRKRHITRPNLQALSGKPAAEQALLLDQMLKPSVPFYECYEFCDKRLNEFYADIALGVKPQMPDDDEPEQEGPIEQAKPDVAQLVALFGQLDQVSPGKASYAAVIGSYQSETQANKHAVVNGYSGFLDAYEALGAGARFDPEERYTQKGLQGDLEEHQEFLRTRDAPVI